MPYLGEIAALTTALLWAGTSLFFSAASQRVGSATVNLTRLMLATVYLTLTVGIMGIPWTLSPTQILLFAVSGWIGLIFGDGFLFLAFERIGPRLSMLVMSLSPAIAAVLAYIVLGERLSAIGIVGIVVTVAGIAMVVTEKRGGSTGQDRISPLGLLYAFFGALGQGVGLIFVKMAFMEHEVPSLLATLVRIVSAVVVLLPWLLFVKRIKNPLTAFRRDSRAFGFTIGGSIIGPYLGITLSLVSVQHAPLGIASTLMSTTPIMLLPMTRWMHGERHSWIALLGAAVAVGGVALLFLG